MTRNNALARHADSARERLANLPFSATALDLAARLDRLPVWPLTLFFRLLLASIFWQSGRTKVEGFNLRQQTFFLFEHEYALPLIDPRWAAYAATLAEHLLPLLLVIGLATRLSAFGLLAMTLVIQVFVYPGAWQTHGLWALGLLLIIARGPGPLSLDNLILRRR